MSGEELLRRIPAVDKVLAAPQVAEATAGLPRRAVVAAIRDVLAAKRSEIRSADAASDRDTFDFATLAALVRERALLFLEGSTKRVINATGVVIHTNLGRAPLAAAALEAIKDVAAGYSNLEYDLRAGERGARTETIEALLTEVTGAEAALVVNNNAAAVLLALTAIGSGREVVVSRGELVEIGGSFRIPEIMAAGGCAMREIGTTNKTRLADYSDAISDRTAILLKVHTSNYKVVGFTESVTLGELVELGDERGPMVIEDLGSGNLLPRPELDERTVAESVAAGAGLVTFSGDKLLGGPQAGLIVGRAEHVALLRAHPLYRALRLDKLSLAALEATLRIYQSAEPRVQIPVLAALLSSADELRDRADRLAELITGTAFEVEVISTAGRVGGGALPGHTIPSSGISLALRDMSAEELAAALRASDPPIISRIENGAVIIDVLAITDDELALVAAGLRAVSG